MADTLPNVTLEPGVWTDLYVESGITPGVKIKVVNLSRTQVLLHTGLTTPDKTSGFVPLAPGESLENVASSTGEWAHAVFNRALINVGVA